MGLEADLGEPDRLVAAWRPLEAIVDTVDIHLLIHEEPRRIVTDETEELTVELLPLLGGRLRPRLLHEPVDLGVGVLGDRLARAEVRSHPVIRLETRQAPPVHEDVLGLVVEDGTDIAPPLPDDL